MDLLLEEWKESRQLSSEFDIDILIHNDVYNSIIDWTTTHTINNAEYTQASRYSQNINQAKLDRASDLISTIEQSIRNAIKLGTKNYCIATIKSFTPSGLMETTITITPASRFKRKFYLVHFGTFNNEFI
jgi:hypothetical protein